MEEMEKTMENLSRELDRALVSMAKAKSLEERVQCSEVVKNLSSSLGVFLTLASDMMGYDEYEEFGDDDLL